MRRWTNLLIICGWGLLGCTERARFVVVLDNISEPGAISASNGTSHDVMLAPGILVVHSDEMRLFQQEEPASSEFEVLAEQGDPAPLLATFEGAEQEVQAYVLGTYDAATYAESPIFPGDAAEVTFEAQEGDHLTVAIMYGESNDIFIACQHVPLFDERGKPLEGDLTGELRLFDAGTEINEEPGLGQNQPLRSAEAGDGEDEGSVVLEIDGTDSAGFAYPTISSMIHLDLASGPVE